MLFPFFHRHSECCGSGCSSSNNNEDEKVSKLELATIILGLVLFISNFIFKFTESQALTLNLISYFLVGKSVIFNALKRIFRLDFFNESSLMTLATFGAFFTGQAPEATGIMLFYRVGEYLQDVSVSKSRNTIKSLLAIKPEYANLKLEDGTIKQTDPNFIKVDDVIVIKVGERVPLDGIIMKGNSLLDTSALTGESTPIVVTVGNSILSGSINKKEVLEIKVSSIYSNSTISKILNLIENATTRKTTTEKFMTRFARIYTPLVFFSALALYLVPTLVFHAPSSVWLNKALIFLLISCPCALVLSIPLGFFTGIGVASRNGILIKGSNFLELLPRIKNIVFDKTGTLTKGVFEVVKISVFDINEKTLLEKALEVERFSTHPIALSILEYYTTKYEEFKPENKGSHSYEEFEGMGMSLSDSKTNSKILAGNEKLFIKKGIDLTNYTDEIKNSSSTKVFIAINDTLKGIIEIADSIKPNATTTVQTLRKWGINTTMLTGDLKNVAQNVAEKIGINNYYAGLLPQDKVLHVEEIKKYGVTAFVGDGINDAPVLALSDIGIAMGGIGSDAAIEASDIVLLTDDIGKIPKAINIAKKTLAVIKVNIFLALFIKALFMTLGTLGLTNLWGAIFADVGVTLLTVFNCSFIVFLKK